MRLKKIERHIRMPVSLLRQRITVLCERDPKQFNNYALHTNQERISFTVQGQGWVYAFVTSSAENDQESNIVIETYATVVNLVDFEVGHKMGLIASCKDGN